MNRFYGLNAQLRLLSEAPGTRVLALSVVRQQAASCLSYSPVRRLGQHSVMRILLEDPEQVDSVLQRLRKDSIDMLLMDSASRGHATSVAAIEVPEELRAMRQTVDLNELTTWSLMLLLTSLHALEPGRRSLVIGAGNLGRRISSSLCARGLTNTLWSRRYSLTDDLSGIGLNNESPSVTNEERGDIRAPYSESPEGEFHIVLACSDNQAGVDDRLLDYLGLEPVIVDVGIRQFSPSLLTSLESRHTPVYRLGVDAGLVAWLAGMEFEARNRNFDSPWLQGESRFAGTGRIHSRGTAVVDSPNAPRDVIGFSDGTGGLLPSSGEGGNMTEGSVGA